MDLLTTSPPANTTFWIVDQSKTHNCFFDDNSWTYTLIPAYILIISVLGIIFNIFVLMVFCLQKKQDGTTADIYLSNLAAADLVLVSFLPFWAIYVSNHYNWTFGRAMCKVFSASILMNAYCSIYFMVLISIDRYLGLVHTMSYKRYRTPCLAKLSCLLVWILGFLFSIPALIHRELTPDRCGVNFPSNPVKLTSEWLIFVLGFIIPIFIISFSSIKIIKSLGSKSHKEVNANKNDNKATRLVLAVLLAFLICWVPFHLIRIPIISSMFHECNEQKVLHICVQIFTYFAYFNSVLNPILYVIVGKNFRNKVKKLFRQWNHKRTPTLKATFTSLRMSSVKSRGIKLDI